MQRHVTNYRGYKIEAEFDQRWLVRFFATSVAVPTLAYPSFFQLKRADLSEVLERAQMRIDNALPAKDGSKQRNEQ
jgi:hypothetical protein